MKQINIERKLQDALIKLNSEAGRSNFKKSIVIMTTTQKFSEDIKIFPTRTVDRYICLPIAIKKNITAKKIIKFFDSKVGVFFIDVENKIGGCENILSKNFSMLKKSKIFQIKSNDFTAESAFAFLSNFFIPLSNKKIFIIGSGNIGSKLALKLVECGCNVFIKNSTKNSTKKTANAINTLKPKECSNKIIPILTKIPKMDCIISFTRGDLAIDSELLKIVKKRGLILDGGTGTISKDALVLADNLGLTVMRLDTRKGFEAHVKLIIDTKNYMTEFYGYKKCGGFKIIAGGYIGNLGDIVVDNIKNPKKVLGVADGKGKLLENSHDFSKNLELVKQVIKQN